MQHFFKSSVYLCCGTFVPLAQGLKPVQKLRTRAERAGAESWVPNSHTQEQTLAVLYPHRELKARAQKENHCHFP